MPIDIDDEVAITLEDQLAIVGAGRAVVSVCCAGEGGLPCPVARIPVDDEVAVVLEPRAEIAGPVRLGGTEEGIARGILGRWDIGMQLVLLEELGEATDKRAYSVKLGIWLLFVDVDVGFSVINTRRDSSNCQDPRRIARAL